MSNPMDVSKDEMEQLGKEVIDEMHEQLGTKNYEDMSTDELYDALVDELGGLDEARTKIVSGGMDVLKKFGSAKQLITDVKELDDYARRIHGRKWVSGKGYIDQSIEL